MLQDELHMLVECEPHALPVEDECLALRLEEQHRLFARVVTTI